MPMISFDTSALDHIVNKGLEHPSSAFRLDQRLIRSYLPLPHQDHSLVLDGIRVLRDSSDAVDQAIQEAHNFINTLRAKSDQLQEAIEQCQTLTAPIRRLPPELLQDIFLEVDATVPARRRWSSPPLTASISQYWRKVTLNTPKLWAKIRFPLELTVKESQYERLELWLDRAASHPIALILETTVASLSKDKWILKDGPVDNGRQLAKDAGERLASAIEGFKDRLEYLELRSTSPAMGFLSGWKISDTFTLPALKTLVVGQYVQHPEHDFEATLSSLCQKCPLLEDVVWCPVEPDNKKFTGPWDRLKTYSGTIPDMSTFTSAPNLQVAYFSGSFTSWPTVSQDTCYTFQNLTSISLSCEPLPLPFPLPALRHLITGHSAGDEKLHALLALWGPQLCFLGIIDNVSPTPEHLATCLSLCPNLEAMRFMSRGLSNLVDSDVLVPFPRHIELCHFQEYGKDARVDSKGLNSLVDLVKGGKWPRTLDTVVCLPNRYSISIDMDVVKKAGEGLSGLGVSLIVGSLGFWIGDFVGPYFDRQGGIFDDLYSARGWDY